MSRIKWGITFIVTALKMLFLLYFQNIITTNFSLPKILLKNNNKKFKLIIRLKKSIHTLLFC